jgi:hypothetical protein
MENGGQEAASYLVQIAMDEPDLKLLDLEVVSQFFAVCFLRHEDEYRSCNRVEPFNRLSKIILE